jgi:hypothetical protein
VKRGEDVESSVEVGVGVGDVTNVSCSVGVFGLRPTSSSRKPCSVFWLGVQRVMLT